MEKGTSFTTRFIQKCMQPEELENINIFIQEVKRRSYMTLEDSSKLISLFGSKVSKFQEELSEEELLKIRSYTGYDFRNINATLRGNWTYDINGLLTKEKTDDYKKISSEISKIIQKFPSLDIDITAYRGTNITAFNDYGITSLDELSSLKNNYLYDRGFTSTSLIRDSSFFKRDLEWGPQSNIEIEYLIPAECQDGAILSSNNLSYSNNQWEFVINSANLSKVIDVEVNKDENTAYIKAVLLPKNLWNIYASENNNSKHI